MSLVTPAPMAGPLSVEIPAIPTISLAQLAPWLMLVTLLSVLTIFFVGSGTMLHEVVHDGRHLLGYPCH